MALLAYSVMIAFLMTSLFIGFEWVATSAPKTVAHHLSPAKSAAVIQKRKTYLAANPWAYAKRNSNNPVPAALASKKPSDESKQIASNEERITEVKPQDSSEQTTQHSGRARRYRPKIAIRRTKDAAGQTAYGYGAPRSGSNNFFFGQNNGFWQGNGTP
jgi:hypothetical protein